MTPPDQTAAPRNRWRVAPERWLLALLAVAAATLTRILLTPWLGPGFPFLTYYPPVLLVTMIAGLWPGIVAASLGLIIAWYLFIEPGQHFALDTPSAVALFVYAIVNGIGIAIVDRLDRLTQRLRAESDRNRELAMREAAAAVAAWQSRERLDALVAQVPVGILEFDLAGFVTLANTRAAALLGRDAAALIGKRWFDLVVDDERPLITAAIDTLIASGRPSSLLTVIALPGGGTQVVRSHLSLARDPEARPQAVLNAIEPVQHQSVIGDAA